MPVKYTHLTQKEQYGILHYSARHFGKNSIVLEKDIWVCWVLKQIFEMPNRLSMAFKGGTSLSKIYKVIDRFSEDIDITLDYRQFEVCKELNLGPNQTVPDSLSRSAIRRLSEALKANVQEYTMDVVIPYLNSQIQLLPNGEDFEVIAEGSEQIRFIYPSAIKEGGRRGYIKDYVLIEFGGRNIIDPSETHFIEPDVAESTDHIEYPSSQVVVLSPERTFWEKATLIHVECHRGVRENAERLSRHWFDLTSLYSDDIGTQAIQNIELLKDVISLKSTFYNASYAHYGECLTGSFRLIPDPEGLTHLESDFSKMNEAGMLNHSSMSFEDVVERIRTIEAHMNQMITEFHV